MSKDFKELQARVTELEERVSLLEGVACFEHPDTVKKVERGMYIPRQIRLGKRKDKHEQKETH